MGFYCCSMLRWHKTRRSTRQLPSFTHLYYQHERVQKLLLLRPLGCEVFPVLKHTTSNTYREVEVYFYAFLTSALMKFSDHLHVPASLPQYPLYMGLSKPYNRSGRVINPCPWRELNSGEFCSRSQVVQKLNIIKSSQQHHHNTKVF